MKPTILYEDNHVLVVVKPPNMPSQEDASGDPDLLSVLKQDIKQRYQKPGNVFLGLVHRLDRPVGGVMLFARTTKAASRLSDDIRTRSIGKQYLAVVHGRPNRPSARLEDYVVKQTRTNTVSVTSADHPQAKLAILNYRLLAVHEDSSLLSVELETGRPHQIRVQLSHLGCPIIGDQRYGHGRSKPGQQIALWSHRLSFTHPVSKEPLRFMSPPPDASPWNFYDIDRVEHMTTYS